jgi:hypothetical protein
VRGCGSVQHDDEVVDHGPDGTRGREGSLVFVSEADGGNVPGGYFNVDCGWTVDLVD